MTPSATRSRILLGALGLSLLFNVFVLVGFVQSRGASSPPHEPGGLQPPKAGETEEAVVQRVARDLQLDESQRSSFAELHAKQRAQGLVFDASIAIVRQDISDELARDNPDPQRLRSLVGQEADLIREKRMAGAELMGKFVDVLSPQQRKMFGRRAGLLPPPDRDRGGRDDMGPPHGSGDQPGPGGPDGRRGPGGDEPRAGGPRGMSGPGNDRDPNRHMGERRFNPGPEIMRRFDLNKNGRLEPEEAQAARQELDARRREFVAGDGMRERGGDRAENRAGPAGNGPREVVEVFGNAAMFPLWRWFDQDADGQLNDAEKQNLREFTASHATPQRPQRDRDVPPPPPAQNEAPRP